MSKEVATTPDGEKDVDMDLNNEDDEYEYGFDITYDEELEHAIQAAESQSQTYLPSGSSHTHDNHHGISVNDGCTIDIEDIPIPLELEVTERLSPFQQFRKKGYLSVSDLVGPIWCETQYDYRLRTLPYLPPSQRPDKIKSKEGNEIVVDKVKVEDKEKILRRGEKIHKRLEREIHPEEIKVPISIQEDVWGLRFLNMLAAMEALLVLGKCRELPVVGFIKGVLIYGIIDEIIREPIPPPPSSTSAPDTSSSTDKPSQTSLKSFFTSSRPKPQPMTGETRPKLKTHRLYISDSKTRASNVLPKEEDTLSGRLQVMLYKELLDSILISTTSVSTLNGNASSSASASAGSSASSSILPSRNPFSWEFIFAHLGLDPQQTFSDGFLEQSKLVVLGNGLRFGAENAKNLDDMIEIWNKYVLELGLGSSPSTSAPSSSQRNGKKGSGKGKEKEKVEEGNLGRTEDLLKLVYRRAGGKKKKIKKDRKGRTTKRRKRAIKTMEAEEKEEEEDQGEAPPPSTSSLTDPGSVWEGLNDSAEEEEKRLIELAIQESLKLPSDTVEKRHMIPDIQTEDQMHIQDQDEEKDKDIRPENESDGLDQNQDEEQVKDEDQDKDQDALPEARSNEPISTEESFPRPPTRTSDQIYWGTDEDSEDEKQEDELAWAVEMSLNPNLDGISGEDVVEDGQGVVHVLNKTPVSSQQSHSLPSETSLSVDEVKECKSNSSTFKMKTKGKTKIHHSKDKFSVKEQLDNDVDEDDKDNPPSGIIIGIHQFTHSPLLLAKHLENVFQFWMGEREPIGVNLEETRRCGWCEFEEGCEWRSKKAEEIWKSRKTS